MEQDYRAVSYEVWQEMAAGWDRRRAWMWELTRPVGEWMLSALDPQPGQTILELASGTGETGFGAAAAVGPEGKVISTDFSPKMVDAARGEARKLGLDNVEHRVMDAERMDLEDASVDGVLCRWGYMLMADPAAALAETRRVLREGGKLVLSVWGDPALNPWASVPGRVLMEHTGGPPPDPTAPGIFAMAAPERTRALVEGAGFRPERMETVQLTYRFGDFGEIWDFLNELAGALAVVIAALPEEDRELVRERIEREAESFRSDGGYEIPGAALNVQAT
jgi:ubiquinone/menaquinone biosynthesis C-methylase UbiE